MGTIRPDPYHPLVSRETTNTLDEIHPFFGVANQSRFASFIHIICIYNYIYIYHVYIYISCIYHVYIYIYIYIMYIYIYISCIYKCDYVYYNFVYIYISSCMSLYMACSPMSNGIKGDRTLRLHTNGHRKNAPQERPRSNRTLACKYTCVHIK